jgi:mannose-6-phosphate isomerase-like protein (cupin superfamily)
MHLRINQNIRRLKDKIHEIPPEQLSYKPAPDKWSKKEILGHLIDSALNNLRRFLIILYSYRNYEVRSYDQDYLVKINNYQEADLDHLVNYWQSLNKQIAYLVKDIPVKKLELEIVIGPDEKRTCQWLIEDYINHMEHHLDQILDAESFPPTHHITKAQAIAKLQDAAPHPFVTLLRHGDLEVEYYKPDKVDKQRPHKKDELYVIASGSGEFVREDYRYKIHSGEVLFVKAGEVHRFENFTDDFATWVIFYGLKR